MPANQKSIFLSYAREDLELLKKIEMALKVNQHVVWRDQESIYGGQNWPKAIGEAIAERDVLILVWSQHAKKATFVEFEWSTAIALKTPIIPCLLDATPLPASLSSYNGIPIQDLGTDFSIILDSLKQLPVKTDSDQSDVVLGELEKILPEKPEKAVTAVREILTQQAANVQGNVYQAGGDININVKNREETPSKRVLLKWYYLVGILVGLLTIAQFAFDFLGPDSDQSLQLTVYVHGEKNQQHIILENTGKLVVDFDNDRRTPMIGENGRTNFGEIPEKFNNREIGIGLEATDYELVYPQKTYKMDGKPIYLAVRKDAGLGRISGSVKSRDGRTFLAGALVLIGTDTSTTTDENGIFKIMLPPKMQVKDSKSYYVLTVKKDGYAAITENYYPKSGDIQLGLEP